MPDPNYVVETQGRRAGLQLHLDTAFYPPLPVEIKLPFLAAFEEYWDFEIDIEELNDRLESDAGYIGGVRNYNFYMFLNEEDLENDY